MNNLDNDFSTSELCDLFTDTIDVVEPIFTSFGGLSRYCGEITVVKCFEERGLVDQLLSTDGTGKVLLIDAGGSLRRALVDADNATLAEENNWSGIVCYGAVRDVDELADLDLGIHAIGSIPVSAADHDNGEVDVAVNFAGVTFFPGDMLYADSSGIITSDQPLHIDAGDEAECDEEFEPGFAPSLASASSLETGEVAELNESHLPQTGAHQGEHLPADVNDAQKKQ